MPAGVTSGRPEPDDKSVAPDESEPVSAADAANALLHAAKQHALHSFPEAWIESDGRARLSEWTFFATVAAVWVAYFELAPRCATAHRIGCFDSVGARRLA